MTLTRTKKRSMKRREFLQALPAGAALWAGLTAGLTAGCGLRRSPLPQRTFVLEAPRPAAGAGSEGAAGPGARGAQGVLLVRPFRVAPTFESRAFIVRRGEAEYSADPYHGFLYTPGPMLTEAVAGWVRGLGVFSLVTTGGSQVPATHALEGEVVELYGDYRQAERPEARLGLELRLLHPYRGSSSPVLWQESLRLGTAMEEADAESLVAGWNEALAEICRSLGRERFAEGR